MTERRRSVPPATDLACVLVLLLLTAAFFFPLLQGYTFTTIAGHHEAVFPWASMHSPFHDVPQSDQADLTYPWRAFVSRELQAGELPLWNPLSFGGQPFFANGSSAVLYPPNLVAALVLPLDWQHDFVSVVHLFLSGLFMYLLMREWRAAYPGALLAATAWMLSSFNMAWLHLEVVAPVAMWVPLSTLMVARAYRSRSWTSTVLAAAVLAFTLTSGHLLFCALVYGIAVVYAAGLTGAAVIGRNTSGADCSGATAGTDTAGTAVLRFVLIAVAPFAFAAVVLLPTIAYLGTLGRASLPYDIARGGIRVPYRVFWHLLEPPALPLSTDSMHEMVYLGVMPALLAAVGFFLRGRGTLLARLLIVGVFLVATDTVLLRWAYWVLPSFSLFSPLGRLFNLFSFGVAVLAGVGFNAALERIRVPKVVLTCAVVGFTAWQLVTYARAINPTFVKRDAQPLFPATPMIQALESSGAVNGTAPGRILPLRPSLVNGWRPPVLYAAESMRFGIDSANGYDSTLPRRAEDLWHFVGGRSLSDIAALEYRRAFNPSFEIDRTRFYMLPRLGVTTIAGYPGLSGDPLWTPERTAALSVRQIYNGTDGQVFALDRASGGPWFVGRVELVDSADASLARFTDVNFDERRSVVIERADLPPVGAPIEPLEASAPGDARVTVTSDGINTLELLVETGRRGWLVVPNVWDVGWAAQIDGRAVPVVRANYAMQALPIDAGGGHVTLRYRPRGLMPGAAITVLTILAAIGGLVRRRRSLSAA